MFLLSWSSGWGQFIFEETFKGTTAAGWSFVQGDSAPGPRLTAGAAPTASDPEFGNSTIDSVGNGWLRLTGDSGFQANAVALDTPIPSAANEISISFDFAIWEGNGADGMTVFLWDAQQAFDPGASGGSLGYAQKTAIDGLSGAYVGVGLDVWGNFSEDDEGRTGGWNASNPTSPFDLPDTGGGSALTANQNQVAVRGPAGAGGNDYFYLAGTGGLNYGDGTLDPITGLNSTTQNLAFNGLTVRPDQDANQFRRMELTLDENNLLTVAVQFGFTAPETTLFTTDLSDFDRPEQLRIGFAGSTGGSTEVHELRNLTITATGGSNSFYWDNEDGDTLWSTGLNWDQDSVPTDYSTIAFTDAFAGTQTAQTVEVDQTGILASALIFSGSSSYTLTDGGQTITLEYDANGSDATEKVYISVLNNPNGNADHQIDANIAFTDNGVIQNLVSQELDINGNLNLNANDLELRNLGTIRLDGVLSGSGNLEKTETGTVVLTQSNTYSGTTTVSGGILQVENNTGLGATSGDTLVESGGTLSLVGGITTASGESLELSGTGSSGQGALANLSGNNNWTGDISLGGDATIGSVSGALTLASGGSLDGGGDTLTFNAQDQITVDRVISNAGEVVQTGTGTTTLTQSNTYGGLTTVSEGTLRIENSGALGGTGSDTVVEDGGTLEFAGGITVGGGESYTVSGSGAAGKASLWSAAGINEIDGAVDVGTSGASFGADAGATLRMDGNVSGSGDITYTGDGVVVVASPNSFTGDVTVDVGATIRYSDAGNRFVDTVGVTVNTGALYDLFGFSDTIGSLAGAGDVDLGSGNLTAGGTNVDTTFSGSMAGTGNFIKEGTGTMTFSGANTFTGELNITGGVVALGADNVFDDLMDVRLDGGTLQTEGFADTFDTLILDSDSNLNYLNTAGGFLTFDDATRNGGTLTIDNWAGDIAGNGNNRLQVTASSLGGSLLDNIEFTGYGGAQLLDLGGGLFEVVPTLDDFLVWNNDQGNARWNRSQNWEDIDGNPVSNDPDFNGAKALISDLDANLAADGIDLRTDITLGALLIDNTVAFDISSNNNNHELFFNNSGAQATLTTVGGTAPRIDREVILQDDLLIQNNSSGTLTFDDSNAGFDLRTGGNQLTFDGSGTTVVDSQVTEGGSVLVKGMGIVEFNDNNTFSGGYTQTSGTVLLGNDNALGSGALNLNGGTIAANGADRVLNESYTLGDNLTIGNDEGRNLTLSGAGTLAAGDRTLTVESGINATLSGDLGGAGGLVKEGTGVLTLGGNDTDFSGGLTVNAGTVSVSEANALTFGADVAGENLLGTSDITTNSGGVLNVAITGGNDINLQGGVRLTNAGGTTTLTGGDDFFLGNGSGSANLVNTGGTMTVTAADDFVVDANSGILVSGGTVNLNPAATFETTGTAGNPATLDVSNGGALNIDLTASGGTGNSFDLGVEDTFAVDGSGSIATISVESSTPVNFDGTVSLTNEGILTINSGTTELDANTRLQGGFPASAGTLVVQDGDLSVDEPLLSNDPNITMDASGSQELTAPNANSSLTGVGTFEKTGSGDVTLGTNLNNLQANSLLINEGSLINGADNQIDNNTAMELAGGTWNTNGFDEIVDTLTLSAESTIDLGSGNSIIQFSKSSSLAWNGGDRLIIENWSGDLVNGGGTDQVLFSSAGLTGGQLGQVYFRNPAGKAPGLYPAAFLGDELVPVPEPGTILGGILLALGAVFFEIRRRRKKRS